MSLADVILSKVNFQELAQEAINKIDPHEVVQAAVAGFKKESDALASDPAKQKQFLDSISTIEDEAVKAIQIIQEVKGK